MNVDTRSLTPLLWRLLFTLSAAGGAVAYVGRFTAVAPPAAVAIAAALGLVGALGGFGVHQLVRHRPPALRIGAYLAMMVLLLGGLALLPRPKMTALLPPAPVPSSPSTPPNIFRTCPVCGYQAIPPDTLLCPVCSVELSETERINWEYASMDEMLREEQAMFFAAEGFQDSDFFRAPPVWQAEGMSYQKDSTWQPVIGREDVLRMRDTLIQAGVIEQ